MKIEEAIDIIDKELHKKWDKKVEKKDGMTYIHLGDEEPLNELEKASQRCLVEVQSLNREIERLNNIIKEVREYIQKNCILSDEWTYLGICNFIPTGKITYKQLTPKKVQKLYEKYLDKEEE